MALQCWRQAPLLGLARNARKLASVASPLVGLAPRRARHAVRLRGSEGPTATMSTAPVAAEAEGDAHQHAASVLEQHLTWPGRSHGCGALGEGELGQEMTLCGWVDRYRNLGGILFLDIRDHTGVVQVGAAAEGGPSGTGCCLW